MNKGERKRELYTLVADLKGYGWIPVEIARVLGVSKRHVEKVIARMKAPPLPWSDLPGLTRERVAEFAKRPDRQASAQSRDQNRACAANAQPQHAGPAT